MAQHYSHPLRHAAPIALALMTLLASCQKQTGYTETELRAMLLPHDSIPAPDESAEDEFIEESGETILGDTLNAQMSVCLVTQEPDGQLYLIDQNGIPMADIHYVNTDLEPQADHNVTVYYRHGHYYFYLLDTPTTDDTDWSTILSDARHWCDTHCK